MAIKLLQKRFPAALYIPALCCLFPFFPAAQPDRCALLIGVGDYSAESGWPKLSARNDVQLLQDVLSDNGFAKKDISTLLDREATKAGIAKAIHERLLLRAKPGGMAVFHFSGHGQQVQDDNGDEPDGLDEALVPYDSPMRYEAGRYQGERLLRDDELGEALRQVRKKLGAEGFLLVTIDACHSGTATRGPQVVARGTHVVMADPAYLQALQQGPGTASHWLAPAEAEEQGLAPMVALFSSSPRQLSFETTDDEGTPYGLFSYAFCKSIFRMPPQSTYRSLMDQVVLEVKAGADNQTPTMEGDTDRELFGNGLLPAPSHFKVSRVFDGARLTIDAGTLHGLSTQSRVALYPAGTTDTSATAPLAAGVISFASLLDADVQLDRKLNKKIAAEARVFLRERSYGALEARVQLRLSNALLRQQIRDRLAGHAYIKIVEEGADLQLEESPGFAGAELNLYQGGDAALWTKAMAAGEAPEKIAQSVLQSAGQYLRANYLRTLTHAHPDIHAEMQLLERKPNGAYEEMAAPRPLIVGEQVLLRIRNTGTEGFYFRLYEVGPNHEITPIIPQKNESASGYFLKPKATFDLEAIIEPPLGIGVLKIIATAEPLETDITRSQRASFNPLEALLHTLTGDPVTRGDTTPPLPAMAGYIGSLVMETKGSSGK